MSYIIIKHYMRELDDDFREITMDEIKKKLNVMRRYAKSCGRKLIYLTMTSVWNGLPLDSDPYAEIEYTGELGNEEKKRYVEFLKQMSLDEEYRLRRNTSPHCILQAVRFTKITDEIIPIL